MLRSEDNLKGSSSSRVAIGI